MHDTYSKVALSITIQAKLGERSLRPVQAAAMGGVCELELRGLASPHFSLGIIHGIEAGRLCSCKDLRRVLVGETATQLQH